MFAATSGFRRSEMAAAADLKEHLRLSLITIDRVHAGELGLLLSERGHRCLLELRRAVKLVIGDLVTDSELEEATHRIRLRKNDLRRALRADLGLLCGEEGAADDGRRNIEP